MKNKIKILLIIDYIIPLKGLIALWIVGIIVLLIGVAEIMAKTWEYK